MTMKIRHKSYERLYFEGKKKIIKLLKYKKLYSKEKAEKEKAFAEIKLNKETYEKWSKETYGKYQYLYFLYNLSVGILGSSWMAIAPEEMMKNE